MTLWAPSHLTSVPFHCYLSSKNSHVYQLLGLLNSPLALASGILWSLLADLDSRLRTATLISYPKINHLITGTSIKRCRRP